MHTQTHTRIYLYYIICINVEDIYIYIHVVKETMPDQSRVNASMDYSVLIFVFAFLQSPGIYFLQRIATVCIGVIHSVYTVHMGALCRHGNRTEQNSYVYLKAHYRVIIIFTDMSKSVHITASTKKLSNLHKNKPN